MRDPEAMRRHRENLDAWRRLSEVEQLARMGVIPHLPRGAGDGRIRVGLLCPCLAHGGAEAWQLALARSTDSALVSWRGVCVVGGLASTSDPMALAHQRLMPVSAGREQASRLAAECDVLIVWAVDELAEILAPLASRPKVVQVSHSPVESPWGVDFNLRASGVDRWVAVSELAVRSIPEPARPGAAVIWNAIDPERLEVRRSRAEMRRAWGVPGDAPVAGYLGRLTAEKDPHAMVRLASALPEPWHVVVIGEGHEREEMERTRSGLGLDRLHLPGKDLAAGDVLNAFDCLVVPSHYESFGLTIAEGLWSRIPVVTTDVGIARMMRPSPTTPIPPDADGSTIADAVRSAVRIDDARAADVLARLAPERFGREWTTLICEVAGPRAPAVEEVRIAMMAEVCPHASGPCGCGSGPPRICGREGRPAEVRRPYCLQCVRADFASGVFSIGA